MAESSYIPGMCNINQAEVAYRRKAMWFGVVASVVVLAVSIVLNFTWWLTDILLFVPVYIATIGFLQVRNKFCVSYGASGKQNASEGSASAHEITDIEARKADKAKTRKMNLQALAMSIAILLCSGLLISILM